jgi:hypothetical protein
MEKLYIPATKNTPEVYLDAEQNKFSIQGVSNSQNAKKFYSKILDELDALSEKALKKLECVFHFEKLAQADLKMNLFLFHRLKSLAREGVQISVQWKVQTADELLKKIAFDLEYMTEIKIDVIELKNNAIRAY